MKVERTRAAKALGLTGAVALLALYVAIQFGADALVLRVVDWIFPGE